MELYELQQTKRRGIQWTETARWIKYEERVEGVDKFWSKPRVAFLAFHSLTQLRLCFLRGIKFLQYSSGRCLNDRTILPGVILLDQDAETYDDLLELVVSTMAKEYQIDDSRIGLLRKAICGNREGYVIAFACRLDVHEPLSASSLIQQIAQAQSDSSPEKSQHLLDNTLGYSKSYCTPVLYVQYSTLVQY